MESQSCWNVEMIENVKSHFQELSTWDIWIVSGDSFMEHKNNFFQRLFKILSESLYKMLGNQLWKQILVSNFRDIQSHDKQPKKICFITKDLGKEKMSTSCFDWIYSYLFFLKNVSNSLEFSVLSFSFKYRFFLFSRLINKLKWDI